MKIFNWVHRKFHQHNVDRYMVSPKQDHFPNTVIAETETVTTETDTKALLELEGITLVDAWKDGILSIGTMGYYEYSLTEEEDEENEEYYSVTSGDEQFKQLAVRPSAASLQKVSSEKSETETAISEISVVSHEITPDTTPLLPEIASEKKRVTLADLLLEEKAAVQISGDKKKISVDLEKTEKISAGIEKKSLLSFGKKKQKDKGEERRPKRKLQRMISKMLKKKVYPDLEGKFNGKEETKDSSKNWMDKIASEQQNEANAMEMATMI